MGHMHSVLYPQLQVLACLSVCLSIHISSSLFPGGQFWIVIYRGSWDLRRPCLAFPSPPFF